MRPVTRVDSLMPAANYKTYSITAPISTHFRAATCEETNCPNLANGWASVIDESTDLGQKQAHYIRKQSGRKFIETRNEAGLTRFEFASGQTCFTPHKVRLERPEIFRVRGGDYRGNPRNTPVVTHKNAEDWRDDFANHQAQLATRLDQG